MLPHIQQAVNRKSFAAEKNVVVRATKRSSLPAAPIVLCSPRNGLAVVWTCHCLADLDISIPTIGSHSSEHRQTSLLRVGQRDGDAEQMIDMYAEEIRYYLQLVEAQAVQIISLRPLGDRRLVDASLRANALAVPRGEEASNP